MQNPLMQTIEALAKEKGIEADTIIRRVRNFPANWHALPDHALYALSLGT